jgi:RNA polymerase sigma factor (sigma-70 family)
VSAQRHRLSEFLAAEWRQLVRAARSWLADTAEQDAEDVVQDVALSLFESTDLAEPIRDLSAYVYRALRNRVVDLYRRRRRSSEPLPEELADERTEAAGVAAGRQLRESVFAAIDRLPAPQRDVFLATELEGSSFRELAEKWGVPIGTLLARKHRAVKALRASLAHLKTLESGGEA